MEKSIMKIALLGVAGLAMKKLFDYKKDPIPSNTTVTQYTEKIEKLKELIDPFVAAYVDKDFMGKDFVKVIENKLTIEEMYHLRSFLSDRYEAFGDKLNALDYLHLIGILDEHLPVEGSIATLSKNYK